MIETHNIQLIYCEKVYFLQIAFSTSNTNANHQQKPADTETDQTPFESLEPSDREITEELARDLLERIKACSPQFFEQLIDGQQLAQLMTEHNVSVTEVERYVLKKPDLDYFEV